MKQRGVFEKERRSGVWWIRYFDQFGKKRREKAGSKSVAIKLYGKRKQQVLEGKKLPEAFRQPSVNFSQLLADAVAYSKRNKRSYKTDVPRFARLKEWFGFHLAEELTPKKIEIVLARAAESEKWAPSTFNHYRSLMSLSYRLAILNHKATSNPARSVTHRRENNNRVRFLTEEEEKKLRKIIEAKWASHLPELDLAINIGLRKGSQYGLTWDMVDWTGRLLNIPRTKNKRCPSFGRLEHTTSPVAPVVRNPEGGHRSIIQRDVYGVLYPCLGQVTPQVTPAKLVFRLSPRKLLYSNHFRGVAQW